MEYDYEEADRRFFYSEFMEDFEKLCALQADNLNEPPSNHPEMSVPMEENKENEVTTEELKECGEKLIEGLKKLMEVEILGFQKAKVEEFERLTRSVKKCSDKLLKKIQDMMEQKPIFAEVLSDIEEDLVSLPHVLKNILDSVKNKNPDGVKKRSVKLTTTLKGLKSSFETLEDDFQKAIANPPMNEEQQAVYDKVIDHIEHGREPALKLFLSGTAGTGKSFVIKKIRDELRSSYGKDSVVICGTTGVASLAIGGKTIHSFLKLPIENSCDDKPEFEPLSEMQLSYVQAALSGTVLLVIDEISMLNNKQLYMMDSRLRQARDSDKEFGGVNILLMGDLLQLPPVNAPFIFEEFKKPKKWFLSGLDLWKKFEYMELSKNCRVSDGPESETAIALGHIRLGHHFWELKDYLRRIPYVPYNLTPCAMEKKLVEENSGKTFIVLCAKRDEAAAVNKEKIQEFPDRKEFAAELSRDKGCDDCPGDKNLLDDSLEVAVGARVMLLYNLNVEGGLANGSIGNVLEIHEDKIVVKFDSSKDGKPTSVERKTICYEQGYETIYKTQFPLRLAYASTVHKAQGLTFDGVVMMVENLFASGQFFVMLSRARDHSLCRITGGNPLKMRVTQKLEAECNRLRESAGMEGLEFNKWKNSSCYYRSNVAVAFELTDKDSEIDNEIRDFITNDLFFYPGAPYQLGGQNSSQTALALVPYPNVDYALGTQLMGYGEATSASGISNVMDVFDLIAYTPAAIVDAFNTIPTLPRTGLPGFVILVANNADSVTAAAASAQTLKDNGFQIITIAFKSAGSFASLGSQASYNFQIHQDAEKQLVAAQIGYILKTTYCGSITTPKPTPCPGRNVYNGDLAIAFEYVQNSVGSQKVTNFVKDTLLKNPEPYGLTKDLNGNQPSKLEILPYPDTYGYPIFGYGSIHYPIDIGNFLAAYSSFQTSNSDPSIKDALDYIYSNPGSSRFKAVLIVASDGTDVSKATASANALKNAGYLVITVAQTASAAVFRPLASGNQYALQIGTGNDDAVAAQIANLLLQASSVCFNDGSTAPPTPPPTTAIPSCDAPYNGKIAVVFELNSVQPDRIQPIVSFVKDNLFNSANYNFATITSAINVPYANTDSYVMEILTYGGAKSLAGLQANVDLLDNNAVLSTTTTMSDGLYWLVNNRPPGYGKAVVIIVGNHKDDDSYNLGISLAQARVLGYQVLSVGVGPSHADFSSLADKPEWYFQVGDSNGQLVADQISSILCHL